MHDPTCYVVPDVCADVSGLYLAEDGIDRILVRGIKGSPRPEQLKATVCVDGGFMAEAELSYAGMNSLARAKLAADIVLERMQKSGFNGEIRRDIIGAFSVLDGGDASASQANNLPFDGDYRVRLSLISADQKPRRHCVTSFSIFIAQDQLLVVDIAVQSRRRWHQPQFC